MLSTSTALWPFCVQHSGGAGQKHKNCLLPLFIIFYTDNISPQGKKRSDNLFSSNRIFLRRWMWPSFNQSISNSCIAWLSCLLHHCSPFSVRMSLLWNTIVIVQQYNSTAQASGSASAWLMKYHHPNESSIWTLRGFLLSFRHHATLFSSNITAQIIIEFYQNLWFMQKKFKNVRTTGNH